MTDKAALGQIVPKSPDCPNGLFLKDGIEGLLSLPRHSVDMLLTDPPYGTTRNFWDVPLPLPELWEAVKWAVKPEGAVLFFAQCPYDKVLGASNLSMLRYEWVWYKERGTGFLNANRAPLKKSENILVFYSELVARINAAPLKKSKSKRLEDSIAAKEKELAKIMRYKQALYQDWKDGEITRNDYRHMSEDYEQQTEALNNILRTLTKEREQLENGMDAESPFLTAFLKYQNIEKLTREILGELIDHIKVYEGGNISVKFKYADEFRRIAEYIELNSTMVTGAAG